MTMDTSLRQPTLLKALRRATEAIGFTMGSEPHTGTLLRALAASKPGGAMLELGTGTGLGTVWIADGMDDASTLLTVDNHEPAVAIARQYLGGDRRITFRVADGATVLTELSRAGARFDFIFADTWPGKIDHLNEALALLAPGGIYAVDDLLPQPSWPSGHAPNVEQFLAALAGHRELVTTRLDCGTGLLVAVRTVD
jgi:predicted O-methyltransferase YrrM